MILVLFGQKTHLVLEINIMKKQIIKIGLPNWLKELISKGKYSDNVLTTNTDSNTYISIKNNLINKHKILDESVEATDLDIINLDKNMNHYEYHANKGIIIITKENG